MKLVLVKKYLFRFLIYSTFYELKNATVYIEKVLERPFDSISREQMHVGKLQTFSLNTKQNLFIKFNKITQYKSLNTEIGNSWGTL